LPINAVSQTSLNDCPLLLEIFTVEHAPDEHSTHDSGDDFVSVAHAAVQSAQPMTSAQLLHVRLRPGDVLTGRVVVTAQESEPVVGISVALRAAVFAAPSFAAPDAASASAVPSAVADAEATAAREAAFGRAEGDLFRHVLVLLGSSHLAPLARARQLPSERLVRGTHVLPFSMQVPDGPASSVLPSFAVDTLGVKVVYSLAAILERRDDGASNLVRPRPGDSALLLRNVHSAKRTLAASTPAYPRPARDAARPALAASVAPPSTQRSVSPRPPPIVIQPATTEFVAPEPPPRSDQPQTGRFELPAPPTNALPLEGQYGGANLVPDDGYAVVSDAPDRHSRSGYAVVPLTAVEGEKPYHSVPPLAAHADDDDADDDDPDDAPVYEPIASTREDFSRASVAMATGTLVARKLPTVPALPLLATEALADPLPVAGQLPQVHHAPKSPRLASPHAAKGISGGHIAAAVLLMRCVGARIPTPPRDWQPASASSVKRRLFSRKPMLLDISIQKSVFVPGDTVHVTIGRWCSVFFHCEPLYTERASAISKLARLQSRGDIFHSSSVAQLTLLFCCSISVRVEEERHSEAAPRRVVPARRRRCHTWRYDDRHGRQGRAGSRRRRRRRPAAQVGSCRRAGQRRRHAQGAPLVVDRRLDRSSVAAHAEISASRRRDDQQYDCAAVAERLDAVVPKHASARCVSAALHRSLAVLFGPDGVDSTEDYCLTAL